MKTKLVFLFLFSLSQVLSAQPYDKSNHRLSKTSTNDFKAKIQTPAITYWVSNNGRGATDPSNGNDLGLYYPTGSNNSLVFADGFVFSGSHNGILKSGGGTYVAGLQAGKILTSGFELNGIYTAPVADSPTKPEYRIYSIYRNWKSLPDSYPEKNRYETDYNNWPLSQGAPVDENNLPKFIGDYVLFYTENDMSASRSNSLYGSHSIGIEIQTTLWSYDRLFDAEKIIFIKKKLVNKSGLPIKDFYLSIWSDPDLGYGGDDLSGVDTILRLAYNYNGKPKDDIYDVPPAMGYVMLSNETQSSFVYYICGGPSEYRDPPLGSIFGTEILNRNQRGLNANGDPLLTGDGKPTRFMLSGDPVVLTGDLDNKFGPCDRRFLYSFGPYDFQPEQSIEVTYAIVVGQGSTNINSITKLKELSKTAHKIYDQFQRNDSFPESPKLTEFSPELTDRKIKLNWEQNTTEIENYKSAGYKFEGYKIYQYLTKDISDPKFLIDYNDIVNGITTVFDSVATGNSYVIDTVANGKNTGIKHSLTIDFDNINHIPLINGFEYNYGLSGVFVRPDTVDGIEVLKNPRFNKVNFPVHFETPLTKIITLKPEHHFELGTGYWYSGDSLQITKTGNFDGTIKVIVTQPENVKGNQFAILFKRDQFNGDTVSTWILKETKKDSLIIRSKTDTTVYVNGLYIKISDIVPDFSDFLVVSNSAGIINPPEYGAADPNHQGFPRLSSKTIDPNINRQQVATGAGIGWGIQTNTTGTGPSDVNFAYFKSRVTRNGGNWSHIVPYDFELRFTVPGSKAVNYYSNGNVIDVPFELWNIGMDTPNDTSDDYRLIPWLNNTQGDPDVFDIGGDHVYSGGLNDPYSDWIYWMSPKNKTPGHAGYDADIADAIADPGNYYGSKIDHEIMARMVISSWNGGISPPHERPLPETGTVFRILTTKPADANTVLSFSFEGKEKYDIKKAKFVLNQNYPNPFNPDTKIQFELGKRGVVSLIIYDILGRQIKVICNESLEPGIHYRYWDGRNSLGSIVSSGIYFYKLSVKSTDGTDLFITTNKMIFLK